MCLFSVLICNRCPTECRLSYSEDPWNCEVSIHYIVGIGGERLPQPKNETFGPIITDKSKLEDRIWRAQRAILTPSAPAKRFLEGDDENFPEAEKTFSRDRVMLQIRGPDCADLSFCDLPGEFVVSTSSNHPDVDLVQALSRTSEETGMITTFS
jgi:hypothetical protein